MKRNSPGSLSETEQAVVYRASLLRSRSEGYSIPSQLELLRDYALHQDLDIAQEFVDVETAKQAGRGSFGEMLKFLARDPSCRALLVEKTDRLYRNLKDWVLIDELELEIHFVKENVVPSHSSRSGRPSRVCGPPTRRLAARQDFPTKG